MAVAFDAFSVGVVDSNFTHNPVGTPRAVIVWVLDVAGTDQVTSVTYGGASLTQVSSSPVLKSTGETGAVHCFFLGSSVPTDDPATVDVTLTAATYTVNCVTLTAADDTEVVDVQTISSDSAANPSATLALSGRTSWCGIGFVSGHDASTGVTPLTNWFDRGESSTGTQQAACYTYNTIGTTDVTAGWTQTAEDAVAIAVAVSEVVVGGDPEGSLIRGKLLNGGLLLGGVLIR